MTKIPTLKNSPDLPGKDEHHGDVIIPGVESEEIEGINEAYEDLMLELGESSHIYKLNLVRLSLIEGLSNQTEDEFPELMPSCLPLLFFDWIVVKLNLFFGQSTTRVEAL